LYCMYRKWARRYVQGANARDEPHLRTATNYQAPKVLAAGRLGGGPDGPADEHNLRTNTTALTLRDLEGPESDELCNVLEVCETEDVREELMERFRNWKAEGRR
jgi:hypothetical protein